MRTKNVLVEEQEEKLQQSPRISRSMYLLHVACWMGEPVPCWTELRRREPGGRGSITAWPVCATPSYSSNLIQRPRKMRSCWINSFRTWYEDVETDDIMMYMVAEQYLKSLSLSLSLAEWSQRHSLLWHWVTLRVSLEDIPVSGLCWAWPLCTGKLAV